MSTDIGRMIRRTLTSTSSHTPPTIIRPSIISKHTNTIFSPFSRHHQTFFRSTFNRLPTTIRCETSKSSTTTTTESAPKVPPNPKILSKKQEGPSTDFSVLAGRLKELALPYWTESGDENIKARWRLAGVLALTLGTTGVSVLFNFLGRDFFNALSAKDQEKFQEMLIKWLAALVLGIPVFVMRDYYQSRLALDWRQWMTERFTSEYFSSRTFYKVQSGALLDNPDQRIAVDVRNFTDTTLAMAITLLNASVDLISFSGILYSIYPPLFGALLVYSIGGTAVSVYIGRSLVGLNFQQEAQEANFRYGLVRVRENAESIAFYGGEDNEFRLLGARLQAAVTNFGQLLVASRNLNFFTSFYRFLIQILPAAVVAPLYFRGEIEFGVINQSASAFNHILGDVSLVVYQFEALAGFSAVVDRLGEFKEVLDVCQGTNGTATNDGMGDPLSSASSRSSDTEEEQTDNEEQQGIDSTSTGAPTATATTAAAFETLTTTTTSSSSSSSPQQQQPDTTKEDEPGVTIIDVPPSPPATQSSSLLDLNHLTLHVPGKSNTILLRNLDLSVHSRHSVLIMGPSGAGKTSLLRTIAGLWQAGSGEIIRHGAPMGRAAGKGEIFFVPQRPYLVLGTLRDQLLYPTWPTAEMEAYTSDSSSDSGNDSEEEERKERKENKKKKKKEKSRDSGVDKNNNNGSKMTWGAARAVPDDSALRAALQTVQLGGVLERVHGDLDAVVDWASVLSLGEQQRVAFARVLLSKAKLVLMDESTSALDTRNESILYKALRTAGITYVSVGHRPTLLQYHEKVLLLQGDGMGGWSLEDAKDVTLETAVNFMD